MDLQYIGTTFHLKTLHLPKLNCINNLICGPDLWGQADVELDSKSTLRGRFDFQSGAEKQCPGTSWVGALAYYKVTL